ncbi:helix-turn-helix domain-containing protein [Macrococcus equi]|uniref:helix-turn-helix domain-containing protein n=1 Tax=Macrococcus equi TaxID=3395462 RepID=UPI0039BEC9F4
MEDNQVALRIKQIRLEHGLTMEDFGVKIDNAHKSLVSKWEKGLSLPNKKRLKLIADMGNITVDELINGNFEEKITNITKTILLEFKEENNIFIEDEPLINKFLSATCYRHHNYAINRGEKFFNETRYKNRLIEDLKLDIDLGNRDLDSFSLFAYRKTDDALEEITLAYVDGMVRDHNIKDIDIENFINDLNKQYEEIKKNIDNLRKDYNFDSVKELDE